VKDGSVSHGLLTYSHYELYSVDEKLVQEPLAGIPTRRLQPGIRKLVIYANFDRGKGAHAALVPLTVDLKPSTEYVIAGDVVGTEVEVWLVEKATGEQASETSKATYSRQGEMMIPIFIPG
jgi:hypothetical protein